MISVLTVPYILYTNCVCVYNQIQNYCVNGAIDDYFAEEIIKIDKKNISWGKKLLIASKEKNYFEIEQMRVAKK